MVPGLQMEGGLFSFPRFLEDRFKTMKNYIAPAAIALGVALLIICAWTFKQRTNLDRYRELLIREIEKTTGTKPDIGRLSLSWSPKITIHGYDLFLSGIPGLGPGSSISIPHIEMPIRFFPLLRKRLQPYRVILNSPVFTVQRLSYEAETVQNETTYGLKPSGANAPRPVDRKPNPVHRKALALDGYTWSGLENVEFQVSDGALLFLSREGELRATMDHISLNSVFRSPGDPIPYQGQFRLSGSKVILSGTVGPISKKPTPSLPPFRTTLKSADFRPGLVLHKFGWSRAPVLEDHPVSLTVDLSGSPGKPLSLEARAEFIEDTLPFLHLLEGRCKADYDPAKDVLALKDFSVKPKVGPGLFKVDGELRNLSRSPDVDLRITIPRFRAYELLVRSGMLSGPADVLHKAFDEVHLDATLAGTMNDLKLKDGLMEIDQASCRFNAQMRLRGPRRIDFDLHTTGLNLDRYITLPWNRPPTTLSSGYAEAYASERNGPVATDSEAGIRLSGRAFVEGGLLGGLRFSTLKTTFKGQNGRYELTPFSFRFYGGSAEANAVLETRADVRRFEMDGALVGVRTSDMSRDLTGTEQIRGLAKMGIQLTGVTPRLEDLINRVEGRAWIRMKHGALVGPDILASVRFVENQMLGGNAPPRVKVPFRRLEGTFRILKGRFHSEDLLLDGPVLAVKGKGSFGLDQTLDVKITPTFFLSAKGSDSKENRFSLPLRVTGSFADATILPDFGELNFGDVMRTLKSFFMGPGPTSAPK